MKLDKAKLDRVLKSPDSIGALLFYGPDEGLAHEYAGLAQKAVLGGAGDDPFRLAELTPDDLKGDGARLADELNAISMLGGRRVVRIAQASNMIADQIETAIAGQVAGSALLVVEAGDIGSKAELVKVFESAEGAGVFACYRDNEAQLGPLIAAHLKAGGYGIARDALGYLAERLGGDRGVTRSELDKLMLYLGDPKREVTLNDAMTCIGDRAAFALDDLIGAAVDGDTAGLDRQYTRSLAEVEAIQVLRSAARHFQRLHQVVARMAAGEPFEAAASSLRPPVFWTQRDRMQRQARHWSAPRIGRALERLIEAESQAMRAYAIKDEIAQRALMDIATLARVGQARRS
jgi:DNA polymerase-3 subunit delta